LIEDERLSLAMEVSTKCGIDPSGVWAAWGVGCLQAGNYQEAREKFNRCLKVSKLDCQRSDFTFSHGISFSDDRGYACSN
jgi:hypothetical protein